MTVVLPLRISWAGLPEGKLQIFSALIQTATNFGAANLFLMNPAGWLFGRTAVLNVGGSFYATTADYIKLGTDGVLFADPAKASALTSAAPSAFGFLTSNPAAIDVQTGTGSFATRLQVPNGKTISLVGGPVSVGAPAGQPPAGFILAQGQDWSGWYRQLSERRLAR